MLELTNVLLQNVLHVLLGVSTLDHQTLSSIHTSTGTQFRKDELHEMLGLTSHTSANV
jgi:predicted transcriptional regulator